MKTGRSTLEWSSSGVIEGSTPDASVATAANAADPGHELMGLGTTHGRPPEGRDAPQSTGRTGREPCFGFAQTSDDMSAARSRPALAASSFPRKAGDVVDEAGELALTQHDELHRCLGDAGRVRGCLSRRASSPSSRPGERLRSCGGGG